MPPNLPSSSRKRDISPSESEHRIFESKRVRVEAGEPPNSNASDEPDRSAKPELHFTPLGGRNYGPSTVYDNANLHNGDNIYHTGPASQIFGPSVLNGDMKIQLSNAFYNCNHNLPKNNPEEDQTRALKSLLYYTTMDDRKAQLTRAQPASLEWVWSTELPLWLENGETIFWISGKPASGKSTLMHYLSVDRHGSEQVLTCLQKSGKKWILVHFYFDFRAGKGIANTGLGMLRSLLLQLVDKSEQVKAYILSRCEHRLDGRWPELESELLDLICDAVSSTGISVCGFVDGLDEYKEDLTRLVSLLQEVHKRSSIKLCLASRPEPELRYQLHECPSFAMQDYNRSTITACIEVATARLEKFIHIQQLRDILTEVVLKNANGVILWAVFAIDEAVKASLCGCTLTEIRQCLDSFPQELFSIYRRIWDSLATQDQLLAAVMFFVIEKWKPSWGYDLYNSTLSSRYFTVLTRSIVRKLDSTYEVEPDYTSLSFRLKTHALLGGLIEGFGEANSVRLAHKSVQSFLHRLPVYLEWTDKISQVVDVDVLGPRTFVDATITVCDALIPEPESFWKSVGRDISQSTPLHRFLKFLTAHLETLKKYKAVDCYTETLDCVWEYVGYFVSDKLNDGYPSCVHALDHPGRTPLMLSVSRTWLIRDYMIPWYLYTTVELNSVYFPRYAALEAFEQRFRAATLHQPRLEISDLLNNHPELLYLIRYSLSHAFTAIVDVRGHLSKIDCDVLFWMFLREWSIPPRFSRKNYDAGALIVVPILESLSWPAYLIARTVIPDSILRLYPLRDNRQHADFQIGTSLWWPYKDMHVLCLWTWMGPRASRPEQLDTFISAGLSLGNDVFEEGNVLHALFEYNPWGQRRLVSPFKYPFSLKLPETAYGHFSKWKFMALVSRGANLHARGLHGTVRQVAERFLASMNAKIPRSAWQIFEYDQIRQEVKEAIAYIDSTSTSAAMF